MLEGLHFLLTYACTYECDHCFLYCSPRAQGTFSLDQLEDAMGQAVSAGVRSVYFEGGEPFLYYPLLLEALRIAKRRGLETGVVTNCYWATTLRDAELWLRPLADIGVADFSVSDDAFHSGDVENSPAKRAAEAARSVGLPSGSICIEPPTTSPTSAHGADGAVIGGDVLFKGRAVDKLTSGLPTRPNEQFDACPHEELESPSRLHVDPFGNLFVCQGISIGNLFERSLESIMSAYRPRQHPIVGPLLAGGPAELARALGYQGAAEHVDHCHLCFEARRALRPRFAATLCPAQVYGVEPS